MASPTRRLFIGLLPVLVLATPALAQGRPAARVWKDFDAYVAKGVKDWDVPGLAIAVVQGDSVLFAKGYGTRTVGREEPVNIHTLFANASTTKAFTALDVAMLVDEGKLGWDDPVAQHLPGFQLSDLVATRELTLRDLLTHRTGFGDPGYLWSGTPYDFAEMIRRARLIPMRSGWRARFAYNNVTYAGAGYIAAKAAGLTWEELTRERILRPLGMNETYPTTTEADTLPNVASPHYRIGDSIRVITRYLTDDIGPAGAMYSSVSDMTRWMRFLLDSARIGGRRLVSDSAFSVLFTPQLLVPPGEFYPTSRLTHPHFAAYGMGWFLEDYRGEFVAFHTGSIDGMVAIVGLLPARRAGVVVFANLDHAEIRHALMYRVFDLLLGGPGRDWNAEMHAMYRARSDTAAMARRKLESARVPGTSPSLPLDRYAGTYADSLYPPVRVRVENGALVAEISSYLTADLEHWHYDTFQARWRNQWLGKDLVSFRLGPDGQVAALDLGEGEVLPRSP